MTRVGRARSLGHRLAGLNLAAMLMLSMAVAGCATVERWTHPRAAAPAAPTHPTDISSPYRAAPPPGQVVEAWSGPVQEVRTDRAMTMYRVFGGDARQLGAWLSPDRPTSRAQVRADLALPPQNTAELVSVVNVPAGTLMRRGTAAPAFGQPGGGEQVQLMEIIPASSFQAPEPLDPG
ncbi:MAG: TNT domain-containing protein [Caulobacteraceae bacterium]|nr:TNT domain-containing protein [Caulobacteraceae bacterium]